VSRFDPEKARLDSGTLEKSPMTKPPVIVSYVHRPARNKRRKAQQAILECGRLVTYRKGAKARAAFFAAGAADPDPETAEFFKRMIRPKDA